MGFPIFNHQIKKPGNYKHNFYAPSCYLCSVLYYIIRIAFYTLAFKYAYIIGYASLEFACV